MINERKNPLSEFGISVSLKLMQKNKTQNWLINEVKNRDNTIYIDSSVLNRVMTGRVRNSKIADCIKEILEMEKGK